METARTDHIKSGIRLYKARRYTNAIEELLQSSDSPGEDPEICYYLGLCYTKLEQYDDALLFLEQVVTNHENILYIYQSRMILSYIYAVTRRYRLAQFELDQLLKSGYESPQVYSAYGFIAYSQSQTEESLGYLQKALSIDPDNANALNSIGYIMAEEEIDIPTAVSYCKTAVRKFPENPAYLDSLGWALVKDDKLEEAKKILRKALNLSGGNETISAHMKEVMRRIKEN